MTGGTIANNTAPKGGGIMLFETKESVINSGTITGNSATGSIGGGILATRGSSLTIKKDVTVTQNTAVLCGGGICVGDFSANSGTLIMQGSSITGNSTTGGSGDDNGGAGVSVINGKFTMDSGSITDNSSSYNGGGVLVSSAGQFDMNSGSITGNDAIRFGGGVLVRGTVILGGTSDITGNTLKDSTAANNVYLYSTTITLGTQTSSNEGNGVLAPVIDQMKIGVKTYTWPTLEAPVTLTTSNGENDYSSIFSSDDSSYNICNDATTSSAQFVKLEKPKNTQTISFTNSALTKSLFFDESVTQTVSGAKTTVTYESSDTSVATVDESTGEITMLKAGTTVITAKAASSSDYSGATASYTLTVEAKIYLWQGYAFPDSACKKYGLAFDSEKTKKTFNIEYTSDTLTYTFTNVDTSSYGECNLYIMGDENTVITLVGNNKIGVKSDTEKTTYDSDNYALKICAKSETVNYNLTLTGDGNLTVYGENAGILAKDIVLGDDFTGSLTVNSNTTAITATSLSLSSGTVTAAAESDGYGLMIDGNISLTNGILNAKGTKAAVYATGTITISDELNITGAGNFADGFNDSGDLVNSTTEFSSSTKVIQNQTGEGALEYVTISETAAVFDDRFGGEVTKDNYSSLYTKNSIPTGDCHAKEQGYTFGGWFTGIDGTGDELTGAPVSGTTYYAKWIKKTTTTDEKDIEKIVVTQALNFEDDSEDATTYAAGTDKAKNTGISWDSDNTKLSLDGATIDVSGDAITTYALRLWSDVDVSKIDVSGINNIIGSCINSEESKYAIEAMLLIITGDDIDEDVLRVNTSYNNTACGIVTGAGIYIKNVTLDVKCQAVGSDENSASMGIFPGYGGMLVDDARVTVYASGGLNAMGIFFATPFIVTGDKASVDLSACSSVQSADCDCITSLWSSSPIATAKATGTDTELTWGESGVKSSGDDTVTKYSYLNGTNIAQQVTLTENKAYSWYFDSYIDSLLSLFSGSTPAESYTISNIDELEAFADIINRDIDSFYYQNETGDYFCKTVKLADDFTNTGMDGTPAKLTTPIGTKAKPFYGIFDGNGKNVELDINLNGSEDQYAGLFGYADDKYNGEIKNVSTSGNVTACGDAVNYAGGIIGGDNTLVANCSSSALISASGGTENYAGGISGVANNANAVYNCYSTGDISASGSATNNAGGLTGTCLSTASINNCYSTGKISASGGITNNAGGITGYVSDPGNIKDCYYLVHDDEDDNKDININLPIYGAYETDNSCFNSMALDYDQMCAGAGETNENWKEINVYDLSDSPQTLTGKSDKISLADAMNECTEWMNNKNSVITFKYWGTVNSNVNNGYPVFTTDDTIELSHRVETNTNGTSYIGIDLPEGITYEYITDSDTSVYTLDSVNIPFRYLGHLSFDKDSAANIKIILKGSNQLGVSADMTELVGLCTNDSTTPVANYGITAEGKNLTITGDSDSSLTIYDAVQGITAGTINIGTSLEAADFTGTLTINDYGTTVVREIVNPGDDACCMQADAVNIHGGELDLNNENSNGISAQTVNIDGGTVDVVGYDAGIYAYSETGDATVNITGGVINTEGTEDPYGYGIYVYTLSGNAKLNISGSNTVVNSTGELVSLYSEGGDVNISGGAIITKANLGVGIYAKNINISGGTTKAKGDSEAIFATDTLIVGETMVISGAGKYAEGIDEYDNPVFDKDELSSNTIAIQNQSGEGAEEYVSLFEHKHSWNYGVDTTTTTNDTLKAWCTEESGKAGCEHFGTDNADILVIVKPAHVKYGDGLSADATFKDDKTSLGGETVSTTNIKYYERNEAGTGWKTDPCDSAPVDAGKYKAEITVQGKTAYVEYEIAKASSEITTKPIGGDGLKYTGQAQNLISNAPEVSNGTIKYVLGENSETAPDTGWSSSIPTGTDAKTYYVWYRVDGDTNYSDIDPECLTVVISKKEITVTITPNGGTYAGTITGATAVLNDLAQDDNVTPVLTYSATGYNSIEVPVNAGTYTVTVTLPESVTNYTLTGTVTAEFVINKASVTAPSIDSKTYTGQILTADVECADKPYTVTTNNGGITAGEYDVILSLSDVTNYKWSDSDDADKTLTFRITQATNGWSTEPDIEDFTYGTSINPIGMPMFGTAVITYTGRDDTEYSESSDAPVNAGTYTATFTVTGTDNYTGLTATVDFKIDKADQSVSSPVAISKTATSIILKEQSGQGATKYGYNTENSAPETWQDSVVFEGLTPRTTYYFFVKYEGNENYYEGISKGSAISTVVCIYGDTLAASEEAQTLLLDDEEAGMYIISGSCCYGFQLMNTDGTYIAYSNGEVVTNSSSAYTWYYDGGLYAEVKTASCVRPRGWGHWWGRCRTTYTVNKYYLSYDGEKFVISNSAVCAEIQVIAEDHVYYYVDNEDGTHEAVCSNCGHHEDPCEHDYTYDETNHKCICGKTDPDQCYVKDVKVTESKICQNVKKRGWWWHRPVCTTTYQYTITAETQNVTVSKVQYSTDNSCWNTGCCFTSSYELSEFYIRITDSNGNVTNWKYVNGDVQNIGLPD